ncbi:hypothetical protein [Lysinibacillus sp. 2017]|uniref:hypothetical protein n=1 Tax=Lysinibacillus sp. 2017 TaxID=2169540 RepID=UPI00131F258C|nr:hypothetical protein [Lysinibacillus sp. 2017]
MLLEKTDSVKWLTGSVNNWLNIGMRYTLGISDKTLKGDLGAICYMLNLVPNAKYELSTNENLAKNYDVQLDKTPAVKGDTSWKQKEYEICVL